MDRKLHHILQDQAQEKGYTLEKLRRETGIADRYLTALFEGNYSKIPAAPYVRGYLVKLSKLLQLDEKTLWDQYRNELAVVSSGALDKLPTNRYALKRINRTWIFIGLLVIFLGVYGAANVNRFLGRPNLMITNPNVETLITTAEIITLAGSIDPEDKLVIDGETVITDTQGNFATEYSLSPGLNRIEFSVKKLLGQEMRVTRTVIYQEQ
jgi:cytoskeletal protein RodZ